MLGLQFLCLKSTNLDPLNTWNGNMIQAFTIKLRDHTMHNLVVDLTM